MAKRKRVRKQSPLPWEVIQITRSPARFIGVVYVADEQAAKTTAIEQFEITKPHEHGAAAAVIVMPCPACGDTGWVCEAHADRPWGDHSNACQCGEPGMPCANPTGGIDEPPKLSPIGRVTLDKNGPRH